MGWEYFCVVGFDLGPLLQGRTRILHLQYFFKYVLTYSLHLNSYLVTFLHNTICRAQLFCPFLLSGSEFLLNMLFNYHLLYFCTALSLIIMLSSHYYLHKSKTLSQLTQCPFTGTLLLFEFWRKWKISFISKNVRDRAILGQISDPQIIRTTLLAPLKTLNFPNFQPPS